MRKTMFRLTILLGAVVFVVMCSGPAVAQVQGPCVDCHTMHSSQGGTLHATWVNRPYDTEIGSLLVDTCLGCHTTTGSDPSSNGYPFVKMAGTPNNYLAGGYFTDGGGDHNDNSHTYGSLEEPAGYDGTELSSDWYTGDEALSGGLTCAGSAGCHGTEDTTDEAEAISGGHHGNNTELGYRLLGVDGEEVIGNGTGGDNDYEEALNDAPSSDDYHNLYSADQTAADEASISELCGKCHGNFHGVDVGDTKNAAGAWIRHPTDEALPADWEIPGTAGEYDENDWKFNPVGMVDAADPGTGGGGALSVYVTCLSCHRAHGSEYNDILRFDYAAQEAGSGSVTTGCLGCHDKQREKP
ncbi:MAG: cytochrome c3 family protein [Deltaproteobacteria bacterium]|nr:cytochrome c3 family protein [Deltaproteobacteria bacterium]